MLPASHLTIAEVEVINVFPRLAKRYAHRHYDYWTIDHRDFLKVTASDGTVGWGETRARPHSHLSPDTYAHLAGRSPFEVVHSADINPGLCTALYDLIGKHVGLPVHALLGGGEKVREWVPCCAWTRPASPADFQADVQRAVDEGCQWQHFIPPCFVCGLCPWVPDDATLSVCRYGDEDAYCSAL
jgi:L-alanine-DL-glutamate epimerase-like enolase superfamily enzyme